MDDTNVGAWIRLDGSRALPTRVGDLVPRSYEAFARLFHPLHVGPGPDVRWSEAAARNDRTMHPDRHVARRAAT
jgi:hypothetical protein